MFLPGRHREPLEHRAALGVDVAQLALVAFPRAVPQLAVDEAHAGHEAVRFDRAQDRRPCSGRSSRSCGRDTGRPTRRPRPTPTPSRGLGRAPGSTRARCPSSGRSCRCAPRRSGRGACRRTRCRRRRCGRACARASPLSGSNAISFAPVAAHTWRPSCVTPWILSAPANGPYSRTISAVGRSSVQCVSCRFSFAALGVAAWEQSSHPAAKQGVTRSS